MPLSAEARGQIQGEVDRIYDMLISGVAEHRRLPPERLRMTEAALYFGDNALGAGLADRLGTIDEAHNALAEHVSPNTRRGTGMTTEHQTDTETGDNVINLDDVRATAVAATRETAGEIAALCTLAGFPELAAEQIRSGASIEAVRQLLQARQASAAAARHVETIDTTTHPATGIGAELAAAVNARFAVQAKGG
jgi:ClpP class serine protease